MRKNIISGLLFLGICSINTAAIAGTNYSYQQTQVQPVYNGQYVQQPLQYASMGTTTGSYGYAQNNTLQGNVVMVPAGTPISAAVTTALSSETASAGQTVCLALNTDFYYGNRLIAPAGSSVYGIVTEVSKAKRGSMNGKLCVRFNQIYTPYGTQIPISAVIRTDDSTGVLSGGTKMDVTKEYAKDLAVGSAAGAVSGVVMGALSGGSIGRGAALGTAVGAGGGLVKSVWDKGNSVEIPAGATIDIILTQPATVSTSSYSYENY